MPISVSRREVVVGISATAVASALPIGAARAANAALNFLVIGDWGRDGASHQRDVAAQMGKAAEATDSRFVVAVGDNFYDNGVQTAQDAQWKTSFEDVYTAPSLQKPWHVLLGNHDYRGNPQAQLDYARTSARWRMPARYYKVEGASVGAPFIDLFMLDTSPMVHKYRTKVESVIARNVATQDVATQLAWLDRELAGSNAAWKIVCGHHTVYSGGSQHGNTPELIELVKPILERHGVQVYINGHDHDMQHIHVGGVDYICSGAGSEVRPTTAIEGTRFCLSRSGFAQIAIDAESLGLEFKDYAGVSVYRATLPRIRTDRARAA